MPDKKGCLSYALYEYLAKLSSNIRLNFNVAENLNGLYEKLSPIRFLSTQVFK